MFCVSGNVIFRFSPTNFVNKSRSGKTRVQVGVRMRHAEILFKFNILQKKRRKIKIAKTTKKDNRTLRIWNSRHTKLIDIKWSTVDSRTLFTEKLLCVAYTNASFSGEMYINTLLIVYRKWFTRNNKKIKRINPTCFSVLLYTIRCDILCHAITFNVFTFSKILKFQIANSLLGMAFGLCWKMFHQKNTLHTQSSIASNQQNYCIWQMV